MKNVISKIADDFIQEALSSPRMLEDLSAMERYMAEAYDGRVFIELLQNADDAGAKSIFVHVEEDSIIVANDGRPFDEKDIVSICRSGASSKQRGDGIGYRGVGFKSTTSISNEIVIYSSGTYFSFSKQRCADKLGKHVNQVPTVRVPFLVDEDELPPSICSLLSKLEADGYSTFFVFECCDREKFIKELYGINSGWMIFLNCISAIKISVDAKAKEYRAIRKPYKHGYTYLQLEDEKDGWIVAHSPNASIAFRFNHEKGVIPCADNEARMYCYLPTLDTSGFAMKINADFSTDPSRKHIILNDSTSMACIKSAAMLTFDFIKKALHDDNATTVLNVFCNHIGLSEPGACFEKELFYLLSTNDWLPMSNGTIANPNSVKIPPDWIDKNSKRIINKTLSSVMNCEVDERVLLKNERLAVLLTTCGAKQYDSSDLSNILQSMQTVTELDVRFIGIAWGYAFRMAYYDSAYFNRCYIPLDDNRFVKVCDATGCLSLAPQFIEGLVSVLRSDELTRFSDGLSWFPRRDTSRNNQNPKKVTGGMAINSPGYSKMSRWKTPVENCISYFRSLGINAKDVSKQAFGYDVIYTHLDGSTRHVVVKPVKVLGDAFSMTDKEYTKMQELEMSYEAFIVATDDPANAHQLVSLKLVSLEKRVKEWEYVCIKYDLSQETNEVINVAQVIDAELVKSFSIKYLNRVQKDFLSTLLENGDVELFAENKQCSIRVVVTQINGIFDFYTGKEILDWQNDIPSIKECYVGSIRYLLENSPDINGGA